MPPKRKRLAQADIDDLPEHIPTRYTRRAVAISTTSSRGGPRTRSGNNPPIIVSTQPSPRNSCLTTLSDSHRNYQSVLSTKLYRPHNFRDETFCMHDYDEEKESIKVLFYWHTYLKIILNGLYKNM